MTSSYLEFRRGLKQGTKVNEITPHKQIAKASDTMKEMLKQYKKLAKMYLAKHPNCEIGMSGCTKVATQIHHVRGRVGEQLLKVEDFKAACSNCNVIEVEEKDAEARALGHKKSRLGKSSKRP